MLDLFFLINYWCGKLQILHKKNIDTGVKDGRVINISTFFKNLLLYTHDKILWKHEEFTTTRNRALASHD